MSQYDHRCEVDGMGTTTRIATIEARLTHRQPVAVPKPLERRTERRSQEERGNPRRHVRLRESIKAQDGSHAAGKHDIATEV